MAKNDQDRRSLEERLASLDAMNSEPDAASEPAQGRPAAPGQAPDFPADPWPASPPMFPVQGQQGPGPMGYAPPPDGGAPPPPPPVGVFGGDGPTQGQAPAAPPAESADAGLAQGAPPAPGYPVPQGQPPFLQGEPPPLPGPPPSPDAPVLQGVPVPDPAQPPGAPQGQFPQGEPPPLPGAPGAEAVPPGDASAAQGVPYAGGAPQVWYGAQPPVPYGQVAPPQGPPLAPLPPIQEVPQQAAAPPTSDSLTAETLLRGRRKAPSGGWRKMVYKATGGAIRPGESPAERRRRELVARASTPVAGGHHRVAVMSLKGGVGKTTTTVGLGATLASIRGDRVIAVDANPDRGTLSDKVRLETSATVRDLLNERSRIQRYADVRAFTSQAPSRLEVLASDQDPAVSEAFSADDYRVVAEILEHFYSICITDCGTGLLHSAMAGVLSLADQLVLVSSPSVDGARSASATLDWLEAHGHGDLVRSGVVVLSMVRARTRSTVDLDKLQEHFESRCRAVVRIPYDDHLEEGAEVDLDQLSPACQDAYLQLAAVVADGFAWPR